MPQNLPQMAVADSLPVNLLSSAPVMDLEATAGFSVMSLLRGLLGMAAILGIAWLFSKSRKDIAWRTVIIGLAIQLLIGLGILYVPAVRWLFEFMGKAFVKILDFTREGSDFLFGSLMDTEKFGAIFAFHILPTIIFFSALASVLFYLRIIQGVVWVFAWLLSRFMKISGVESLSVVGNIFLGQTESPLMIKGYLPRMNPSEILLVMTGGMATLAGGVLALYIGFLGGDDPAQRLLFAKHLLTASVMAAPGAVVIAKILVPQTGDVSREMPISKDLIGSNLLDAISKGTTDGLKLAANVGVMLLVFLAFIAFANYLFLKLGDLTHLNEGISRMTQGKYEVLSLQFILGYTFSPLMWLIGVCPEDMTLMGRLLGEKVILTELVGFKSLAELKAAGAFMQTRSIIMATYMLAGFANFSSIGVQIGGIGALAPNQRGLLSHFGMRALLGGTLASLMSATIIGMILG